MKNISAGAIFAFVFLAAAAVRVVALVNFSESPLKWYSEVPGLDMKTLLSMGADLSHGEMKFSLYSFILAIFMKLGAAGRSLTFAVVVFQMCLGTVSGLIAADFARRIYKAPEAALLCGLAAALYAPGLMYECFALKETLFTFCAFSSLYMLFLCRESGFKYLFLFAAGALSFLPACARLSALLWAAGAAALLAAELFAGAEKGARLRFFARRFGVFAAGAAFVCVSVALFNVSVSGDIAPQTPNVRYYLTAGAVQDITNLNVDSPPGGWDNAGGIADKLGAPALYIKKFIGLFKSLELSNNLNYNFIRHILPPMTLLPGPSLIIPLALLGAVLGLALKARRRCFIYLWVYLLAFAIPICMFVPLGRYRLALFPVFCLLAWAPAEWVMREFKARAKFRFYVLAGAVALWGLVFWWSVPKNIPIRTEDYVSLGLAWTAGEGISSENAGQAFESAWTLNPGSLSAGNNLSKNLMARGKWPEAVYVLGKLRETHPGNERILLNYSLSLICAGDPVRAEETLRAWAEKNYERSAAKSTLHFYLGETKRLQNKPREAAEEYRKALALSASDAEKTMISRALSAAREANAVNDP